MYTSKQPYICIYLPPLINKQGTFDSAFCGKMMVGANIPTLIFTRLVSKYKYCFNKRAICCLHGE